MTPILLLIPFLSPVAAGAGWGVFTFVRGRRRMSAAFARGRAESVVRLPVRVVPMPTLPGLETAA